MADEVVDASVLAAIAFAEPRVEEAANLLAGATLHAPTLLAYELASVALRKSRLNPHLQPALVAALEDALALDLVWADVDQAAAFELALDLDLTSYDASYLYLARSLGADLVTFDAKLSKAASRLADT